MVDFSRAVMSAIVQSGTTDRDNIERASRHNRYKPQVSHAPWTGYLQLSALVSRRKFGSVGEARREANSHESQGFQQNQISGT